MLMLLQTPQLLNSNGFVKAPAQGSRGACLLQKLLIFSSEDFRSIIPPANTLGMGLTWSDFHCSKSIRHDMPLFLYRPQVCFSPSLIQSSLPTPSDHCTRIHTALFIFWHRCQLRAAPLFSPGLCLGLVHDPTKLLPAGISSMATAS